MCLVDELERGRGQFQWKMVRAKAWRVRHSQWGARDAEANKISGEERLQWNGEGAWRSGVVQNFQTGGSDPAKQVISKRVRGNESVPRWVVSIKVSEDESVRGVRKDVRIEGPGARIRRTVSDGRGVEVKKLKRRVVGEKDFNTGVV